MREMNITASWNLELGIRNYAGVRERIPNSIFLITSSHLKRWRLRNPHDDRRPRKIVGRRGADDLPHRGTIVVLESAAERVREQLFGHRLGKAVGLFEQI